MIPSILVMLATVMRLLPHPANFTPMSSVALFGGAHLKKRYALILPIVALVLSDIFIGFDSLESRLTVYGSFILIGLIGFALRKKQSVGTVVGASVAGSLLFYLITNFVFFYPVTMYTHDFAGMMQSYYNALPFLRNMMLGDLFYTSVLFGSHYLATNPHVIMKLDPRARLANTKST